MSEVDSTLEMSAPAFLPSEQVARSKQPLDLPVVMGLLGDWVQGLHSQLLLPPGPLTGQKAQLSPGPRGLAGAQLRAKPCIKQPLTPSDCTSGPEG